MSVIVRCLSLVLCLVIVTASPLMAAEINLSAAASLKEVLNELTNRFVRKHPGVNFLKNFGGSGLLAKQIENGAPADIFIPANVEWMDVLAGKKMIDPATVRNFAFNTLVFAGPPGKKVSALQDLAGLQRIAIGSPRSVPAGEYAKEALQSAGMEKQLDRKLVMAKDVRESLMYAERGEVDGAFVYRTDALQAKTVVIHFTVPQSLYPRIVYPMGLTAGGARKGEAAAFLKYLQSSEARGVLARYGFALN